MQNEFGLTSDQACTESQALDFITQTISKRQLYRFVLLDLDDPTIYIGRFISTLEKIIEAECNDDITIDVYGCSENNSEPMLKKCAQNNVAFIHKPLTRENCFIFAERYPPAEDNDDMVEQQNDNSMLSNQIN